MRIVELGDYSMTVMKDSEDPPWVSVGDIYREAQNRKHKIVVAKYDSNYKGPEIISSDAICASGKLILFFKDTIKPYFDVNDKVHLFTMLA